MTPPPSLIVRISALKQANNCSFQSLHILLFFWIEERVTSEIFEKNRRFWSQTLMHVTDYLFVNDWWSYVLSSSTDGFKLLHEMEQFLCCGTHHVIRGNPQVSLSLILH